MSMPKSLCSSFAIVLRVSIGKSDGKFKVLPSGKFIFSTYVAVANLSYSLALCRAKPCIPDN